MTTVRRALALSFLERYLSIVLALGSGMVLARLLTPEQIGMYSVTLAVIGLAHVLREFGVGNYLIQQKDLNDDHVRTAFGLALVMGTTLAVVILAVAPWVGRFYSSPEMVGLMRIVALNFLVLPFCSISLSLLRRDMKFKALLYVSLAAMSLGTAVTLVLAWAGHGPTSMAVGAVAGNVATGFGAWWARGRPPALRPGWKEWRVVLNFGGQSAATGIVTAVAMDINDLVLGKVLGFAPVAILSRAQGTVGLFTRELLGSARNVLYPAFANYHRTDGDVETFHNRCVSFITSVGWAFFGFLSLFPLEVTRLLFGPQWDQSASLISAMAFGGALYCLSSLVLPLLTAVGRVDLVTKVELPFQITRAAAMATVAVTTHSLLACALTYSATQLLYLFTVYFVKQFHHPTNWATLIRGCGKSLGVVTFSLILAMPISALHGLSRDLPLPIHFFLMAAISTPILWFAAIFIFRHPAAEEPIVLKLTNRFSRKVAVNQ